MKQDSRGSRESQKSRQFCRQVQRALNLALADCAIDGIGDLFIYEVVPAPDCGRLVVYVLLPVDQPAANVMAALQREAPKLRSEMASAISRKRAPELYFVPVTDGGPDE